MEKNKVIDKVSKLLNMTRDNGASETEAMKAAEEAGKLMQTYNIQISDIENNNEKNLKTELKEIYIKGKNRNHMDAIVVALASYCDCKAWFSKVRGSEKQSKYCFFGLENDVVVAEYLYNIIEESYLRELRYFKKSNEYLSAPSRKSATNNFTKGFAGRISDRLRRMKKEHEEQNENYRKQEESKTGKEIVLLSDEKDDVIKEGMKNMGVRLRKHYGSGGGRFDPDSYSKGINAGDRVHIGTGIGQDTAYLPAS